MILRTGGAHYYAADDSVEVVAAGGGDTPWWLTVGVTPIAAYAAKGAADLASSYINLANPGTFNAAPGVAPTWDVATGWTFNGTTQYLTTGVVPVNNQTWSVFVRYSAVTVINNRVLVGVSSGGTGILRFFMRATPRVDYSNGGVLTVNGSIPAAAVLAIAGNVAYRDGVAEAGNILTATGTFTQGFFIGAHNIAGVASLFFAGNIVAVWIADSTLDAAQVATMSTAMSQL